MNGLLQTSFFFGYNAVVCYAFFLMLGSVGFTASLTFVRHIYRCVAAALSDHGLIVAKSMHFILLQHQLQLNG